MNLLNEILDFLEYEQLINEGKDPSELLHYKYGYVPSDIIDAIISIDPTKKKSYSQWLLSKWKDESDVIVDNLKNGRIAKLFDHYKNHQDVQIKSCPSVAEGLRMFVPEEDSVLVKSSKPKTTLMNNGWVVEVDSDSANDFDVVFDGDGWIIAVPNSYNASCKLGENMRWCTAGGRSSYRDGISYYNRYLNDYGGKYYVNFDMSRGESMYGKDYPFTRYQFHFESHQFMDKNDEPVELSEIEMPESAKKFYLSEGYSEEDFEDLEAKAERYEEQRWAVCHQINNELYLGISYDEDYEFEEPNEGTDYYLFSVNDDRDPISWDEFPNPLVNDDFILDKNDDYVLLNAKNGDDTILAIKQIDNSRRFAIDEWNVYSLNKFITLPNDLGFFGSIKVGNSTSHYSYGAISYNGDDIYETNLKADNCELMTINEACTSADASKWDRVFIEAVSNGYHSLFAVYEDEASNGIVCDCIIKRDTPINGETYFINENGFIEGEFSKYNAYDEGDENSESSVKYSLEEKLPNGNYIVSMPLNDSKKEVFNVMDKDTRSIILKEWVEDVVGLRCGLYFTNKNGKQGYFGKNGDLIGEWYKASSVLDEEHGIIGCQRAEYGIFEMISAKEEIVFARFGGYVPLMPKNGKMIVVDENENPRCYDFINRTYCFNEYEYMRKITNSCKFLWCKIKGRDEYVIFDFDKQTPLMNGVKSISKIGGYGTNAFKIEKLNGKCNALGEIGNDTKYYWDLLLPTDADNIVDVSPILRSVIFTLGNKYFAYNYAQGEMLVNPNGTDVPAMFDSYGYLTYGNGINFVSFYGNKLKRWYRETESGNYNGGGDRIDERTPKEIVDLYNRVIGNYSSVSENFKRFVNRINEAAKLSLMDLID